MIHKAGWILFLGAALAFAVFKMFGWAYDPIKFYNRSGQITKSMRIWTDTIAVTSSTPAINISSAGFSNIVSVQPQIIQTSVSLTNFTWCNVTTYSTSSVSLFLAQENSSTVNILGSLVLLGTPLQAPSSFSNMFVALQVIGY